MSISAWHMRDSNLYCRPKNTAKVRKRYSEAEVDRFYELIVEGYSVAKAVKMTGIPLTKGYTLVEAPGLKAVYENNKRLGFKK